MRVHDQPTHEAAAIPPTGDNTLSGDAAHGLYRFGLLYGRQIYRLRWLIIGVWVAVFAISLPGAARVSSVLSGGGFSFNGSESVHVSDLLINKLHAPPSQAFVVFHATDTTVTDSAYQAQLSAFVTRAQAVKNVRSVTQGGVSADGKTTFYIVDFSKDADYMQQHFVEFRDTVPTGAAASPAHPYVTGSIETYQEFTNLANEGATKADESALPLALLVLLLIFGTLVAALMPMMLAVVAVPVALAAIYLVALHTSMSSSVLNIASIIGLGLSIDYSLFMVRRFREELAKGSAVPDAIGWTIATSGEAILFSGLTVMIGFIGMLLIGIQFMTSLGIGGALVVLADMLAALTLLPAVLSVLGPRINALKLPFINRFTTVAPHDGTDGATPGIWHRLAVGVMQHPIIIIVLVTAVLLGVGWPLLSIQLGTPDITALPSTSESRQGTDLLHQNFPGSDANLIYLVAQTTDGSAMLSANNLTHLATLTDWLKAQRHIVGTTGLLQLPPSPNTTPPTTDQLIALYSSGAYQQNPAMAQLVTGTTSQDISLITLQSDTKLDSTQGKQLIDDLRAHYTNAHADLKVQIGGIQAILLDFNRYLYGNFPRTIIFIFAATYVLLLLMFRSVVLPLKAVVMNVLSISAAFGIMVMIFQWGFLANLLGFTSEGFIESTTPILMFCILFGLSMDYEVFLLSRIREEWLRTHDNRYAVARGLEMTGGVITNAALLLIIVAGAVALTPLVSTKQVGLGIAVSVLIDAAIIRTLLVPATMRLIGRWNWWLPGLPVPVEQHHTAE